MTTRGRALLVSVALTLVSGCKTVPQPPNPSPAPVKFAVIAAPEIGSDPDALATLQQAMTRVTLTKGLSFVLVPGPLLATGATKEALDDLRSTLDYSTVPLYISFAGSSTTKDGAGPAPAAVSADEVLTALESRGPGKGKKIAFRAHPDGCPDVCVVALGVDGKAPPLDDKEGTRSRTVAMAAVGVAPDDGATGLLVKATSAGSFALASEGPRLVLSAPAVKGAAALGLVTWESGTVKVEVLPLDPKEKATATHGPLPIAPK